MYLWKDSPCAAVGVGSGRLSHERASSDICTAPCPPQPLPARGEVFLRSDRRKSSILRPLQQQHTHLFAFEPLQGKIPEQKEVILLPAAGIAVVPGEPSLVQSGVGRPPELRTQERRGGKPQPRRKASALRGDRPIALRPAETFCYEQCRNKLDTDI